MKQKNYKSAIHNFAHSFQSVDFTKSSVLAVNLLIELNQKGEKSKLVFDFINKEVKADSTITHLSKKLLSDYNDWLPEHLHNHRCDIDKLEKLEIEISIDFTDSALSGRNYSKEYSVKTKTFWKIAEQKEEIVEICLIEPISNKELKIGLPTISVRDLMN
jgi:hypothetical protein